MNIFKRAALFLSSAGFSKNILFAIIVLFTLYMAMPGVIGIINI